MIIRNEKLLEEAKAQAAKQLKDEDIKRLNEILYSILKSMK
ncbi:hypothetical protein [Psychrobacillus sp. BM2]